MSFNARVESATRRLAKQKQLDESALLAVVEVECGGEPFEADGVTPRFLFERHKFYQYLKKHEPDNLRVAVDAGLAIPKWDRKNQYKDLGTSKGRMAVLERAKAISLEGAHWASSWGIGQIMGFNAAALGYGTATQMVAALKSGGVAAQVDAMYRFLKSKGIIPYLNRRDFDNVARLYNGDGYAANDYDTRLEASCKRWDAKSQGVNVEEEEDVPLGRTPVQNAEAPSMWKTPEGISSAVASGMGVLAAVNGAKSEKGAGPIEYGLGVVIVIAALVAAYYFIRRLRRMPE